MYYNTIKALHEIRKTLITYRIDPHPTTKSDLIINYSRNIIRSDLVVVYLRPHPPKIPCTSVPIKNKHFAPTEHNNDVKIVIMQSGGNPATKLYKLV